MAAAITASLHTGFILKIFLGLGVGIDNTARLARAGGGDQESASPWDPSKTTNGLFLRTSRPFK